MSHKILITLTLLGISWGVRAHNPDLSSTMLVEQGHNQWVLQVRAALTAFEYEIAHHYGESAYDSPEAFQELLSQYVREHISVRFNESNALTLQNGRVKLGHETSVSFALMGTPETIQSLEVKNSSFKDLPRNQSALIVLKEGFAKDQFLLNENNEHAVKLTVSDARFELLTPAHEKTNYSLVLVVWALLGLAILSFALQNRQTLASIPVPSNAQ